MRSLCLGLSALMSLVLGVSNAHAWGAHGHQIVSYVGSELTGQNGEPFWTSNSENMRTLSTVPDRLWKGAKTKAAEGPTHFFQADYYVKDINQCDDILNFPKKYTDAADKYGEDVLVKNGTAPYRVVQMYNLAVAAFRRGDMAEGVEDVGVMSHYIGDLSQPLHVSENYDGQETGNGGIHAWFETTNIADEMSIRDEVMTRAEALLKDADYMKEASGDLADVLNHEIVRSLEKRDEVLQNDTKLGRKTKKAQQVQLDLAEDRMADGAAVLSIVMERLSRDAGLTQKSTEIPIEDPEWISPDYESVFSKTKSQHGLMTPFVSNLEDDCDAI